MSASSNTPARRYDEVSDDDVADVLLIGGGIVSTTLGSMLSVLESQWRIVVLGRADALAAESSHPWNNADTGHSGFCELNYMPDPADGMVELAEQPVEQEPGRRCSVPIAVVSAAPVVIARHCTIR